MLHRKGERRPVGAIIGSSLGGLMLIIIITVLLLIIVYKRYHKKVRNIVIHMELSYMQHEQYYNINYLLLLLLHIKVTQLSVTSDDQAKLLDTEDAMELGKKLSSGEFEAVSEDL